MNFSNFISSFTPLTDINLNDYVNLTATSAIGSYDVFPQSYNNNKPYFDLDTEDILNINKHTKIKNNITVEGIIYNSTLYNAVADIHTSIATKADITQTSDLFLKKSDASSLFQLSGNYLTNASLFQASGNYLTNASLFQASGNYLTNASLFQASGNYLTDAIFIFNYRVII
jgi:hypothetical protein